MRYKLKNMQVNQELNCYLNAYKICRSLVFIGILPFLLLPSTNIEALDQSSLAVKLDKQLQKHSRKFGKKLKISFHVRELDSGQGIYSYNSDRYLIPASVMKLLTSSIALKTLGAGYRYPTEIFADEDPASNYKPSQMTTGNAGNLYVRGYGDPSMVDEKIWMLAKSLYSNGLRRFHHLYLDDTLFVDAPNPSGERAYEAGLSALTLNHNSYAIHVYPTSRGQIALATTTDGAPLEVVNNIKTTSGSGQKIVIAQSPVSGRYKRAKAGRTPDGCSRYPDKKFRLTLSGTIGENSKGITYYRSVPDPSYFFGSILDHHLKKLGVKRTGFFCMGETPAKAENILVFESKPLGEILSDLNKYSNNVSASQVLYTVGQDNSGYFSKNAAIARVRSLIREIGVSGNGFSMEDGSGLGRANKLSASLLTAVLFDAFADFSSSPEYISSLAQFGQVGTMKKRSLNQSSEKKVWGKTGTLTGASSLAGFLQMNSGKEVAYAIIINGSLSKSTSVQIENGLIKTLLAG